ncbi:hypothetical protein ACFL3Q_14535, partial [Planctomycetota bacterium]
MIENGEKILHSNQRRPVETAIANISQLARAHVNGPEGQATDGCPHEHRVSSDHSNFDVAAKPKREPSLSHRRIGWIVLGAYSLLLVYLALSHKAGGEATNIPVWKLQNSHQLLVWIGGFIFRGFCEFAYFVPIGFITALVFPHDWRWHRRFPLNFSALTAGSIFVFLIRTIEIDQSWHLAEVVSMVLPLLGCLFGVWIGTTWLRGRWARLWLLPKIAALVLVAGLCAGIILSLSVERTSLSFEPARVTSAEKRRLAYLIRSKSPRGLIEGQTHTLQLTGHDIDVLLTWGLSLGSPNRKAKVSLAPDTASL